MYYENLALVDLSKWAKDTNYSMNADEEKSFAAFSKRASFATAGIFGTAAILAFSYLRPKRTQVMPLSKFFAVSGIFLVVPVVAMYSCARLIHRQLIYELLHTPASPMQNQLKDLIAEKYPEGTKLIRHLQVEKVDLT